MLKEAGVDADKIKQGGGASQVFKQVFGADVKAEIELQLGKSAALVGKRRIKVAELQELLLWVLGNGSSPRWAFVKHKALISTVVLVVLEGVDTAELKSNKAWDVLAAALPAMSCDLQVSFVY